MLKYIFQKSILKSIFNKLKNIVNYIALFQKIARY